MSFLSYFGTSCAKCGSDNNENDNVPTSPTKKSAFEDELIAQTIAQFGDENAPPPRNAQSPQKAADKVQQDPVKPKSAEKQKGTEKKPSLKAQLKRLAKEEGKSQPLPSPPKETPPQRQLTTSSKETAPKAEEPKVAGPFSDGSKLQVQLETGWVDCSEAEVLQVGGQLAADTKKFAVNARGAMYIMDFTDPNAPTQTHSLSKKTRKMRIVKP